MELTPEQEHALLDIIDGWSATLPPGSQGLPEGIYGLRWMLADEARREEVGATAPLMNVLPAFRREESRSDGRSSGKQSLVWHLPLHELWLPARRVFLASAANVP